MFGDKKGHVFRPKSIPDLYGKSPLAGQVRQTPEFTSQYQGAAPFTLAGKSYTVTDPVTGAAYAAAGAAEEQPAAAGDFDPAQWRTFDTSPEAEATRKMYAAGAYLLGFEGRGTGR